MRKSVTPAKVEIRTSGARHQLFVNGQAFFIKGAGIGLGSMEQLAAHGGNSIRTWRPGNGRESGLAMLDRAQANGLYVMLGLEVGRERHGFDYNDSVAVARQREAIRAQVFKYKDHPALIIWAIGNELNLDARNPKVWDAVNDISKMIHELDPNHLTTSPVAGFNPSLARELRTRAPDLDVLSVQMYADIVNLPRYLQEADWTGPYLVTEWGATGHWEVPKTDWGAVLENDSSTKAQNYRRRYGAVMAADDRQCLGSYAFLWGQKQERTPTWYGMFLASGEATEVVDAVQYLWSGHWPTNRSPRIAGAWLDQKTASQNVRLLAGGKYRAKVASSDPDGDPLAYAWEVMPESTAQTTGGDFEARPQSLSGLLASPNTSEVELTAPSEPGAYRLFAYVRDGKGRAAHVNIPFYVEVHRTASAER